MNEIILLKLGEMVLKGLNRRSFEDKLQANICRRLRPLGQFRVYTRQSTTYVEPMNADCDMDGAWEAMKKVFGVVGLSRARSCEKDKDAILAACREYLDSHDIIAAPVERVYHRVAHLIILVYDILYFLRIDIFTVLCDYDIFLSACYIQPALAVKKSQITCVEPAVNDRFSSQLRHIVVSEHDIFALVPYLAYAVLVRIYDLHPAVLYAYAC